MLPRIRWSAWHTIGFLQHAILCEAEFRKEKHRNPIIACCTEFSVSADLMTYSLCLSAFVASFFATKALRHKGKASLIFDIGYATDSMVCTQRIKLHTEIRGSKSINLIKLFRHSAFSDILERNRFIFLHQ